MMDEGTSQARQRVLSFIDSTFDSIFSELSKRPFGKPKIVLQQISAIRTDCEASNNEPSRRVTSKEITYAWPGRTSYEAWAFTCAGQILNEIQCAITSGLVITKRDIYYRHPSLFQDQETVNRYVEDIAFSCGVSRSDLNVIASPKGLYMGMVADDHRVYNIQEDMTVNKEVVGHLNWILVVEKEATFNALRETKFHKNSNAGLGLVITGKGFPDLATMKFLKTLTDTCDVPVYGVFDADPDGLDILRCYAVGSKVSVRESSICRRMIWLPMDLCAAEDKHKLPLTLRDRHKARGMICKGAWTACCPGISGYLEVLQQMLMLNHKAEIPGVEHSGHLVDWLGSRLKG